jgi:hypothetical protein
MDHIYKLRRNTLIVAGVSFFCSGYSDLELLLEASGNTILGFDLFIFRNDIE